MEGSPAAIIELRDAPAASAELSEMCNQTFGDRHLARPKCAQIPATETGLGWLAAFLGSSNGSEGATIVTFPVSSSRLTTVRPTVPISRRPFALPGSDMPLISRRIVGKLVGRLKAAQRTSAFARP